MLVQAYCNLLCVKMFKFVLPLFLIAVCKHGQAQERFIAIITEYALDNFSGAVGRCPGTIITDRHLLTTAACATPTNDSMLIGITINFDFGGGMTGSTSLPALRVHIHPEFKGDVYSNNIAVVRVRISLS